MPLCSIHWGSTSGLLFEKSKVTNSLDTADSVMVELGHAMQRGDEGMRQLTVNGEECYVFFKPLGETDWSAAIVCPEKD